jgi:CheY-specific phosphatase CheX
MSVRGAELSAIVQEVWRSMLGLDARLSSPPPAAGTRLEAYDGLIGCVGLAGSLEGAVVLACPGPLARRAASVMFDLPIEQVEESEVSDVLGELTNVVAGNLVSNCLDGCQVQLPKVLDPASYERGFASIRLVEDLAFECPAGAFLLRVHERAADAGR